VGPSLNLARGMEGGAGRARVPVAIVPGGFALDDLGGGPRAGFDLGDMARGRGAVEGVSHGTVPIKISMISPMPFWPSLEPCANDTPVQVRIRIARIHNGGGAALSGAA